MAMRCVKQIADDCSEKHPMVSDLLRNDIFMDDILSGVNNIKDAITLSNDLIKILDKRCFKLAKWVSNNPRVLPQVVNVSSKVENNQSVTLDFENPDNTKVLGLWWNPNSDTLTFHVNKPEIPPILTKR